MTETINPPGPPAEQPSLRAPLRTPSFRNLWAAQSFSLLGDGFSTVAFAWITLTLTRSSLALGVVLACQAVPRALLTLLGGALSDRMSARHLMMFSSLLRCALMAGVAAAGFTHLLNLWMLFAAAALFGAVDAFFQPARSSVLPSVVEPEQLEPANALLSVGSRVASVLGPAIGGIVVAATDPSAAFAVDSCCFALVALFVGRATRRVAAPAARTGADTAEESLGGRIRAGLVYVFSDPRIRAMVAIDTAVTFCYAGPFTVGFASLAKFRLHGGASSLGLLDGALAAGAIVGALLGGATRRHLRVGLLISALTGWLGAGMLALGVLGNLAEAVGVVLLMGLGIGFQGVFGVSWIQRNIRGEILGRVISVDMVAGYIAAPVSLVLCGALAKSHLGAMFAATAAVLIVTGAATLCSKPVVTMT
ncbi:MFS transporter [Kitasatospora sp. NPDC088134]|uniref:MFS transporter n=1 Tax=Kitasatospora sp. NPDC088134 TaxID=3364071 RepID=UPI0037FA1D8E